MQSPSLSEHAGSRQVGSVLAEFSISNYGDEGDVRRGLLAAGSVRSIQLREVLVDTGALTLCLPSRLIQSLGLPFDREVHVLTAAGEHESRMFANARVRVMGRSGIFECLELPDDTQPLLGVMPLEGLGVELDLRHRLLVLRPDTGRSNFLTA